MNLVSWNSAIQIKKRVPVDENVPTSSKLWCDTVRPRKQEQLCGNPKALEQIREWFRSAKKDEEKSACLFIHGESGTGKTTAVSLISKSMGFHPVETYADRPRTPARLEGVVREANMYGCTGVVVLDDFEIFLSETTSLRTLSKFIRQLLSSEGDASSRCLFVIISNSTHKSFGSLLDISTVVGFDRLPPKDMLAIFNRVSSKVSGTSYVPPMASFFASSSCGGTITQAIQQLQFMYCFNEVPRFVRRPRKKHKAGTRVSDVSQKTNKDNVSYLWSEMYTDKMLENVTDSKFDPGMVLERLFGFGKDRLDIIGSQLFEEYPKRTSTSNAKTMARLSGIAEDISLADTNRMECHEDGLFDSENKEKWAENDVSYISCISSAISGIKGVERREYTGPKKKIPRLAANDSVGSPMDDYFRRLIAQGKND